MILCRKIKKTLAGFSQRESQIHILCYCILIKIKKQTKLKIKSIHTIMVTLLSKHLKKLIFLYNKNGLNWPELTVILVQNLFQMDPVLLNFLFIKEPWKKVHHSFHKIYKYIIYKNNSCCQHWYWQNIFLWVLKDHMTLNAGKVRLKNAGINYLCKYNI